jgi:hypothetical protein
MILEDGQHYKKIATIQEMKNALWEDNTLKKYGSNEDERMNNMFGHMAKFPQDRQLLKAKLKEYGYASVEEVGDRLEESDKFSFTTLSMNGHMERLVQMEQKLIEMQNVLYGVKAPTYGTVANLAGEVEGELLSTEASMLAYMTNVAVGRRTEQVQYAVPRTLYSELVTPLIGKPAMYDDNQYIIGEFVLQRKRGVKEEDAIRALTAAKTKMSLDHVMHDGIVLHASAHNRIGLVHTQEREHSQVRFYLVSQKPILTDLQFAAAMTKLPEVFKTRTQVSDLNVVVMTDATKEQIQYEMENLYNVSDDKKELIGDRNGVTFHYDEVKRLLRLKVTPSKKVATEQVALSLEGIAKGLKIDLRHPFNEYTHIITTSEAYQNVTKSYENTDFGVARPTFEEVKDDNGNTRRIFTTNGWWMNPNLEAEEFLAQRAGMTHEAFKESFVCVSCDSDHDAYLFRSDGDRTGYVRFMRSENPYRGQTVEQFLRANVKLGENEEITKAVEELNASILAQEV